MRPHKAQKPKGETTTECHIYSSIEEGKDIAKQDMITSAKLLKANAVIGVTFQVTVPNNIAVHCFSGTAILVEPEPPRVVS